MTFVLVALTGFGIILMVSALDNVSIADTVRGFINGQVATKAGSQTTRQTASK
jgi:hypothetical protein